MSLKPFVYWAQTENDIFLKIDVQCDGAEPEVSIEEEEIEFYSRGGGGGGSGDTPKKYHFVVEFFLPVDKSRSRYEVRDREVQIYLKKKEPDWWPRLLYQHQKLPWLKIDFDKWKSDDTDDNNSDDDANKFQDGISCAEALRHKFPDVYKQLQREELGFVSESKRKMYLFCYNLFMFCGFLYVFCIMNVHYAKQGEAFLPLAYRTVGNMFKMLHLLMILEIMHPLFGYTRGSVNEAIIQVIGRLFILFAMMEAEPRMQEKPVVFYLFMMYSFIELIRYPYYMLRTYDIDLGFITWLRYTAWVPLYPAGFVCEGVIILRNIPYFEETNRFSVGLPNPFNFAFHFPTLLRAYLLFGFFPVLYTMMNHMYQLRCKRLNIKQHRLNKRKKAD